jgi:hypothetical protein
VSAQKSANIALLQSRRRFSRFSPLKIRTKVAARGVFVPSQILIIIVGGCAREDDNYLQSNSSNFLFCTQVQG